MHRHVELVPAWLLKFRTPAVLCGPNSHNRAKRTTPKQIISVNTRNNKIYPIMTRAKSLLFNVTLLVQPGLEPKIARFGGPHGVSCDRGLNVRHGPPQYPHIHTYTHTYVHTYTRTHARARARAHTHTYVGLMTWCGISPRQTTHTRTYGIYKCKH
jgi:hypothetical protein